MSNPPNTFSADDAGAVGPVSYTAFSGTRCIGRGDLVDVALHARKILETLTEPQLLIFDDRTGDVIDVDLQGSVADVEARATRAAAPGPTEPQAPPRPVSRGPGRPRLGVVAREVTLLPRHWEWLAHQPGGASVALRKLVEEARRANGGKDRVRQSREAAYRFMSAMAGNEAGFEEAARALFAGRSDDFGQHIASWPKDVRVHAARLAARSFETTPPAAIDAAASPSISRA